MSAFVLSSSYYPGGFLMHEIPADEDNFPGIGVEGQTTLSPSNQPERGSGNIWNEDRANWSKRAQIEGVNRHRPVYRSSGKEAGIQVRVRYHDGRSRETGEREAPKRSSG